MSTYNRTLVLVISKSNTQLMADITLMLSTNDVNKMISKCNSKLKYYLKSGSVPRVNVRKNIVDLAKICEIEYIDFKEIRILIHDKDENIPVNGINMDKSTHTIEVCPSMDNQNITTPFRQYDLRVVVNSTEQVLAVIEDVILDIQMFHFYNLESEFKTIEDKRNFSELKKIFCDSRNSCYNFINEDHYCSFVSYCRDENLNLDYEKYCKLWYEFYKQITSQPKDTSNVRTIDELVYYIISNHEQGQQISPRKLRALIKKECVNNGMYTLIRWSRRPKTREETNKIKFLLKGHWVRVGKIIIVPSSKRYIYQSNEEYFSLFDFNYFSD